MFKGKEKKHFFLEKIFLLFFTSSWAYARACFHTHTHTRVETDDPSPYFPYIINPNSSPGGADSKARPMTRSRPASLNT